VPDAAQADDRFGNAFRHRRRNVVAPTGQSKEVANAAED
jgi:hypothetical protein